MGLMNAHQLNHSPLLLHPYHHSPPQTGNLVKETLFVPSLSHFEAKGENRQECKGSVSSKEVRQLEKHGSLSNSKSASAQASVTSKQVLEEGCSDLLDCTRTTCHKVPMGGDDEIHVSSTVIHTPLNEIHPTSNDVKSNECCFSESCGDDDNATENSEITVKVETSCHTHPKCIDSNSHSTKTALKVDHLVIDGKCELRKLLSDESGFYDTSSPSEPPPTDLSSWWQQSVQLNCDEDDEDMEWDDDEGECFLT